MANSVPKFANRAKATLASAAASDDLTITVGAGQGALLPDLGPETFTPAVIIGNGIYEEVNITGRAGDTLTVERSVGADDAVAQDWLSGTEIFVDVPAREMEALRKGGRILSTETWGVEVEGVPVLQVAGANGATYRRGVRDHAGSYALTPSDAAYDLHRLVSASAATFTLPAHVAGMVPGMQMTFKQTGAGLLTIAAAAGVTLNSLDDKRDSAGQHAFICAVYEAENVWGLAGGLA